MEEKKELNLVEILKDCPKGMTLWSPCWGDLTYNGIDWNEYGAWKSDDDEEEGFFPILTTWVESDLSFNPYGKYVNNGDVMIYPSKENRDWSTFKVEKPKWNPDTLQPFDKVLVRDVVSQYWCGNLYLYTDKETDSEYPYSCINDSAKYCIPYNKETKHLLGTNQEPPEYYRL
jgi:hypothetical protein